MRAVRRAEPLSSLSARVLGLLPEATLHREAEDDRALTLFGPPGTGKTTSMLRLLDAHLEAGTIDPDRLAVLTFTRNAQAEAKSRLKAATGISEDDWPWVRTIHSACYRLLGLSSDQVMGPNDWREFGQEHGYTFTQHKEREEEDPLGGGTVLTFGDWCVAAEELRRARRWSIEEAVIQLGRVRPPCADNWGLEAAQDFMRNLAAFKREHRLLDFTDMLEVVLREQLRPPCTHYFVDEAQDLTPLQWAVVDLWTERAKRTFTFGDDDQAIFEWSGADPHALMHRPGHQLVLSKTWRLPEDVHAEADRIVRRVRIRVPKEFRPVGPGGAVGRKWAWDQIDLSIPGRHLLLARNRAHLELARDWLIRQGRPFLDRSSGGGVPAPGSPRSRAVITALDLHEDRIVVSRGELRNLRRHVWADLWPSDSIPRSPMAKATALIDMGAAPELVRRLVMDPFSALKLGSRQAREYLTKLIQRHGRAALEAVPNVEISTIHGVKGEEAEHVYVCTAMSTQTHAAYQSEPDAEHRVFYVAASRAKQSLDWINIGGLSYEL